MILLRDSRSSQISHKYIGHSNLYSSTPSPNLHDTLCIRNITPRSALAPVHTSDYARPWTPLHLVLSLSSSVYFSHGHGGLFYCSQGTARRPLSVSSVLFEASHEHRGELIPRFQLILSLSPLLLSRPEAVLV